VRRARKLIFKLKNKPIENWNQEEIEAAEIVCSTYDTVALMIRHKLLPSDIIAHSWGSSLRNSFQILAPLIRRYRQDFVSPEYWANYEWLALEATKIQRKQENSFFKRTLNGIRATMRGAKLLTVRLPKITRRATPKHTTKK
jgi:hypothetical protein